MRRLKRGLLAVLYFFIMTTSIYIFNAEKEFTEEEFTKIESQYEPKGILLGICYYDAEKKDILNLLNNLKKDNTFDLGEDAEVKAVVCENEEAITQTITDTNRLGNIVLVVSGKLAPAVASLTQTIKVHSIILLDPTVTGKTTIQELPEKQEFQKQEIQEEDQPEVAPEEQKTWAQTVWGYAKAAVDLGKSAVVHTTRLTESVVSRAAQKGKDIKESFNPITFEYNNIEHRIYNFYSEASSAATGYRKIIPGLGTKNKSYFLKAVNVKCITSMADCYYHALQFWSSLGLKNFNFTRRAKLLFEKIPELIKNIDKNYYLNTDLTCFLNYKEEDKPLQCNPNDLIITGTKPLLVINRFIILNKKEKLQYLVAKATKLTKATILDDYLWEEGQFDSESIQQIRTRLETEGKENAKKMEEYLFLPAARSPLLYTSYLQEWRKLIYSYTPSLLPSNITSYFSKSGEKEKEKSLTNLDEWKKIKECLLMKEALKKDLAYVRKGNNLCQEEKAYKEKREEAATKNLKKLLGIELNKKPVIAIAGSGGGVRAMLTMLGALKGLSDIGILDCTTYICGLSGSSWALGLLMAVAEHMHRQKKNNDLNITEPLDSVISKIVNNLKNDYKSIATQGLFDAKLDDARLIQYAFNQPRTLVDFWGAILGSFLFDQMGKWNFLLSDQKRVLDIDNPKFPIPIYTAININEYEDIESSGDKLEVVDVKVKKAVDEDITPKWYEFTPYEIGGDWLNAYVKTWAFGRKFAYGISQDMAPEQTLWTFLGVFGSAIAANIKKMMPKWKKTLEWTKLADKRFTKGRFFNFTYGMYGTTIEDQKYMDMVDAGIAFNLPYPPISGKRKNNKGQPVRKADIIIFVDASNDRNEPGRQLRKVKKWADHNVLKFPNLHNTLRKNAVEVISPSSQKDAPLIIYIPLIKDNNLWEENKKEEFIKTFTVESDIQKEIDHFNYAKCMKAECSTFNAQYTPRQAERLIRLMQFNVWANKDKIKDAILKYLE